MAWRRRSCQGPTWAGFSSPTPASRARRVGARREVRSSSSWSFFAGRHRSPTSASLAGRACRGHHTTHHGGPPRSGGARRRSGRRPSAAVGKRLPGRRSPLPRSRPHPHSSADVPICTVAPALVRVPRVPASSSPATCSRCTSCARSPSCAAPARAAVPPCWLTNELVDRLPRPNSSRQLRPALADREVDCRATRLLPSQPALSSLHGHQGRFRRSP